MSQAEIQSDVQTVLLPGVWEIDPAHSNVEFVARHLLSKVRGRFTGFEGAITIADDPSRSSVEATIDAGSIDTGNPDRDAHLRSPDFLDVEQHPTISFRSTSVGARGEGRYRVDGDLRIRGVTRPVTLELEYLGWSDDPWGGKRAGFSASTEIDRHDFGATWNLAVETGGVVVGRKVGSGSVWADPLPQGPHRARDRGGAAPGLTVGPRCGGRA